MNNEDMKLQINPEFENMIPELTDDELSQLEENILAEGRIVNPIVVWNGVIVDGHNRYKIAQKHPHIQFTVHEKEFEPYKGKIRKSGTGCVTMINDYLYEGRFTPRVNGKRISKNVYAKTREECEEKLAELIKQMKAEIAEMKKATNA